VNQQHYLTRAFILGVVFNVIGNVLVIPNFGYVGAAIVTILSEFSLLFPFYVSVRRNVGVVPWVSLFARPLLATAAMGAAIYALVQIDVNVWLATAVGVVVYAIALWLLGTLRGEEMTVVRRALINGNTSE
jgi:O-antigen/teichoic acid export membrane protein